MKGKKNEKKNGQKLILCFAHRYEINDVKRKHREIVLSHILPTCDGARGEASLALFERNDLVCHITKRLVVKHWCRFLLIFFNLLIIQVLLNFTGLSVSVYIF